MSRRRGVTIAFVSACMVACSLLLAPVSLSAVPQTTPFPSLRPPAGCEQFPDLASGATSQAELEQRCHEQLLILGMGPAIAYARGELDYAGMAYQREGGFRASFWFTTDLPEHQAALQALAPSGMPLEVLPADLTLTELRGIQRLLTLDERKLRKEGIRISTVGVDQVHNVVEVGLRDENEEALAVLQARYGPHVTTTVMGPIQEDVGASPSPAP